VIELLRDTRAGASSGKYDYLREKRAVHRATAFLGKNAADRYSIFPRPRLCRCALFRPLHIAQKT
jgi:hypothetical protein